VQNLGQFWGQININDPGIAACVLALVLRDIGETTIAVYDGSWDLM